MSDTTKGTRAGAPRKAGAFDIRVFIGALLGIYGVILVLAGLFGTSEDDLDRAGGTNVNLWTGIGLVIFSACFIAWARLRPVVVPPDRDDA
jgi:drug/metabolite transporter (DMT)-like permease